MEFSSIFLQQKQETFILVSAELTSILSNSKPISNSQLITHQKNYFICIIRPFRISLFTFARVGESAKRERTVVGNTFRLGYIFRMQQKLFPKSPLSGMYKKLKRGKGPTDIYS